MLSGLKLDMVQTQMPPNIISMTGCPVCVTLGMCFFLWQIWQFQKEMSKTTEAAQSFFQVHQAMIHVCMI